MRRIAFLEFGLAGFGYEQCMMPSADWMLNSNWHVLAVALVAGYRHAFGRLSRYGETVRYSAALFLHFTPGTVETLTRLPAGAPYLARSLEIGRGY